MSDTMSIAEDRFEKMYVEDMVEHSKKTKLETSLNNFIIDSNKKLGKEKNATIKRAIEKQLLIAQRSLEAETFKRQEYVRKEARNTFRGMTVDQKFDLAKNYADRGINTTLCNQFIRELGRKADREELGELNNRTDAYFHRPDEHDIRRKMLEKLNAKIAAMEAQNASKDKVRVQHAPGDLQQSEVVEVDNSLDDYKKKRENIRQGDYKGRYIPFGDE